MQQELGMIQVQLWWLFMTCRGNITKSHKDTLELCLWHCSSRVKSDWCTIRTEAVNTFVVCCFVLGFWFFFNQRIERWRVMQYLRGFLSSLSSWLTFIVHGCTPWITGTGHGRLPALMHLTYTWTLESKLMCCGDVRLHGRAMVDNIKGLIGGSKMSFYVHWPR